MASQPPTLELALQRIRSYARAATISPTALARMADLSDRSTRDMHRDGWSPSSTTIRKLEAVIPPDWMPPAAAAAAQEAA